MTVGVGVPTGTSLLSSYASCCEVLLIAFRPSVQWSITLFPFEFM